MTLYERVRSWQRAMGLFCGNQKFDDPMFQERRMRLIAEEACETLTALTGCRVTIQVGMWSISKWDERPNPVRFADGLADLTFVCNGSFAELGWDGDAICNEICDSNDTKTGGTVDANGKLQKPAGYRPPELERFVK